MKTNSSIAQPKAAVKPGYVIKIPVNGQPEIVSVDKADLLHELQRLVDGYVETVPVGNGRWIMVVNEEGKLQGLEHNAAASALIRGDTVVGNAVIVKRVPDNIAAFDNKDYVKRRILPAFMPDKTQLLGQLK